MRCRVTCRSARSSSNCLDAGEEVVDAMRSLSAVSAISQHLLERACGRCAHHLRHDGDVRAAAYDGEPMPGLMTVRARSS